MKDDQKGAFPAPPKGFVLEGPSVPPPPAGFQLESPAGQQKQAKSGGFGGIASEVGKMLYDLPVQAGGAFAQAIEGSTPYAERDWKDSLVEKAQERTRERLAEPDVDQPLPFGLTRRDFRNTGASLGFTGVSAGAGLAGGIPAAIAATPAAGYAAGGALSGAAAYRMAGNSFVRSIIESEDEERTSAGKQPMTDAERQARQAEIQDQASEYGLWEAVPEAVGNVAGLKLLATPLKRMLGKNVATRVLSKLGGLYGTELATETVTQMGQNNIEAQFDSERERRAFDDPAAYWESLKEVAPQVFILTTLMGGAGAAGVAVYRRGVEDPARAKAYKDAANDFNQLRVIPDNQLETLITEGKDLAGRRKSDGDLRAAVGRLEQERDLRRQRAEFDAQRPPADGIEVTGEAQGIDESIDLGAFAPPPVPAPPEFPDDIRPTGPAPVLDSGGIGVEELPLSAAGGAFGPSPIRQMADRLRDRVQKTRVAGAFTQAERDADARRASDLEQMARAGQQQPKLGDITARMRQRSPEVAGALAQRLREQEDAAGTTGERTPYGGLSDLPAAPPNGAMADALRRAGAVKEETSQSTETSPDEIR
ncbi:MAG: hypothetical protein KDE45_25120, partial [Caldilineaceae bacterium]|nr:hypothetical protein [Caldilineaceae bacterium]